jgi:glucosamine kinase
MILIADSGSTKTDWFLAGSDGLMNHFHTSGINPYVLRQHEIVEILRKELMLRIVPQSVTHVYFYGAGCSTEVRCKEVSDALSDIFLSATIEVDHDLLGAARALCRKSEGIACILGTGSNSCLFDGYKIVDNIPSLGYILGDEGSGSHIGKTLLKKYFYRNMPDDIKDAFVLAYGISREEVLESVYRQAVPNRYLASFSLFASKFIDHPYMRVILSDIFNEFIEMQICKYSDYLKKTIHFTGSVAYTYQAIIKELLESKNISWGIFLKNPVESLATFHIETQKKS